MDKKMDLKIMVRCKICERLFVLDANSEDFNKWQKDTNIQDAFPYMKLHERELLLSGFCEECWHELLPPEEEEPEDDDDFSFEEDDDDEDE